MMAANAFNYDRSAWYFERSIRKVIESLKTAITKSSTADNISKVSLCITELNGKYDEFKQCTKEGFYSIDETTLKSD